MEQAQTNEQEVKEIEIKRVKLDFNSLDSWIKPNSDELPIYSFLSLYEACGLMLSIEEYCSKGNTTIVAVDNILCNFYTIQHLKKYIEEQWKHYSLDIDADNHVFWDTKKFEKGTKHYSKNLKKEVEASLQVDFANFCPGIDDELEDDVIVFRIYEKSSLES